MAGPRFFCAGGKARPQPCPGGPREPGRRQDPPPAPLGWPLPLTEPRFLATGQGSGRGPGTGEEGQYGHGSSSHALQPLKLRAREGLLRGHLAQPLGLSLEPHPALPTFSCLCPGLPMHSFSPTSTCLPTHIPYRGPVCTPATSSGTSPASSLFSQAPV